MYSGVLQAETCLVSLVHPLLRHLKQQQHGLSAAEGPCTTASPAPRPQALSPRPSLSPQVNNATARVMTNKKVANPYTNGKGQREGLQQAGAALGTALSGCREALAMNALHTCRERTAPALGRSAAPRALLLPGDGAVAPQSTVESECPVLTSSLCPQAGS